MQRITSKILFLFIVTLFKQGQAQQKGEKIAVADSAGVIGRTITDLGAHAPEIDWYLIILNLIWILLILLFGYIITRYVLQPIRVLAAREKNRSALLTRLVFTVQIFVWLMVTYLILFKVIRVSQITEILIGATLGLAILMASRDVLINLLAGIRIHLIKIFKPGDRIKLSDMDGIVEKIGLTSTTIRHGENQTGLIPNRLFLQEPIKELISAGTYAPVLVNFYFPADGNFVKIREIAERAASLSKYIYLNEPVTINLANIFREGRSLVHLQLTAYVLDSNFEREFRSEISEQLLAEIFRQNLLSVDQMNF